MTNTTHTRTRRISSIALSGLTAVCFVLSGCGADEPSENSTPRNRAAAPVQVTSTPAPTPVTPSVVPKEAVLEVKEEAPKVVTYADAEAAFQEKDYVAAVERFALYTEQNESNPWGYYMLGLSSYRTGDFEAAKAAYRAALDLDERHVKSWINLSRAQLKAGETTDALVSLDQALTLDSASVDVYRLQGRAFHNMGQHPEAIAAYKQALLFDGSDAWSMNNLALIYIEEEQFDQALPALALAVETNGNQALFFNNLGMVLEHHGQVQTAAEMYRQALEIDAVNEKAQANLDRIANVKEALGVEPVDLTEEAQKFRDALENWKPAETTEESPEAEEILYEEADGC